MSRTDSVPTTGTTAQRREAMLGLGLGNTLEWYDWMIFGLLSSLVGPHFFRPATRSRRR